MMHEEKDGFIEWIENTQLSARLKNTLRRYHCEYPNDTREELTKEKFFAMKGVGKGQWKELEELLS